MLPIADVRTMSSRQALDRLSIGEHLQGVRISGLLDLDPLVVSRWLCGEDMRGVYQPISLRACQLDGIDLVGRTFYEMVEMIGCRISMAHFSGAYFYADLIIEDCVFEADLHGRGIQSDGRVVIHNTVFNGWTDLSDVSMRSRVSLVDVSFPGGTNLLQALTDGARDRIGDDILFHNCRFRPGDTPAELDAARLGILPLVEGDPGGAES
jgi:hypothetical protein